MMKKRLLFYGSAVFLSAILGLSACAGSSKSVQTTAAMPAADYEAMDSAERVKGLWRSRRVWNWTRVRLG
jgi:hypothetical protein